jgi:hypothetical protein
MPSVCHWMPRDEPSSDAQCFAFDKQSGASSSRVSLAARRSSSVRALRISTHRRMSVIHAQRSTWVGRLSVAVATIEKCRSARFLKDRPLPNVTTDGNLAVLTADGQSRTGQRLQVALVLGYA